MATSTRAVAVLAVVIVFACDGAHASARRFPIEQDAPKPSFDCSTAVTPAEQLICGDSQLARLDVELARVYQLALRASELDASRKKELEATERRWIKNRDECLKAGDRRQCVAESYVLRMHELRQIYSATGIADAAGISRGPFVTRCQGLNELVSTQFVSAEPPMVSLLWMDTYALVLTAVPSDSGTRYARKYDDGEYAYWEKGSEALFQTPGRSDMNCRITESE